MEILNMSALEFNNKFRGKLVVVEYRGERYTTSSKEHPCWTNHQRAVCLEVCFRASSLPLKQCKFIETLLN